MPWAASGRTATEVCAREIRALVNLIALVLYIGNLMLLWRRHFRVLTRTVLHFAELSKETEDARY